MFSRPRHPNCLITALGVLAIASFTGTAGAATVSDPGGDVVACTGECSNGDTDLKSLTAEINGANLDVTVTQYGTGGCKPFTQAGYWPIIEVYTTAAAPAGPPTTSMMITTGDFAVTGATNGNCAVAPTIFNYRVRAVPTGYLGAGSTLATVTANIFDPSGATYSVPLSAFGANTANLRVRAWQSSDVPAGAVDVVPDAGLLGVTGGSGGGGGGGGGGGPLNNLNTLPKSATLKKSFSGKLPLTGPADRIDLSLVSGSLPVAQASKSKVVGKKSLTNVGPGDVKFSVPISKSFRKGIKKGKKVKLTFKAVVYAPGLQPVTLTKRITFKKKS